VIGALLELAGILTVALGISRTRTRFGRPSMAQQSLASMRRFAARFRRKKENVVVGVGSGRLIMRGGRAHDTALQGSFPEDVTLEERIERLRTTMNQHSESLTRLDRRIDDERKERQKSQEQADRQRAELATRLEGIIEDLAVGSLRLETWVYSLWCSASSAALEATSSANSHEAHREPAPHGEPAVSDPQPLDTPKQGHMAP